MTEVEDGGGLSTYFNVSEIPDDWPCFGRSVTSDSGGLRGRKFSWNMSEDKVVTGGTILLSTMVPTRKGGTTGGSNSQIFCFDRVYVKSLELDFNTAYALITPLRFSVFSFFVFSDLNEEHLSSYFVIRLVNRSYWVTAWTIGFGHKNIGSNQNSFFRICLHYTYRVKDRTSYVSYLRSHGKEIVPRTCIIKMNEGPGNDRSV